MEKIIQKVCIIQVEKLVELKVYQIVGKLNEIVVEKAVIKIRGKIIENIGKN